MKFKFLSIGITCMAILFATIISIGCGAEKTDNKALQNQKGTELQGEMKEPKNEAERKAETDVKTDSNDKGTDSGRTTEQLVGADTEQFQEEDEIEGDGGFREVTVSELANLTEFIHRWDAYGFLLSEYTIPEEADLGEVFYSGAGLRETSLTNEECDAYLRASGQEEIFTTLAKISKSDAERVVMNRLGLSLEEVDISKIGVYIPEFDAYYAEDSDTNYMQYTCLDGIVNGNVYTVEFSAETDMEWKFSRVQTILEKTDEGYCFISNTILE